jgi:hypothetical protein
MNRISPEQARELVQRTARHAETPRERAMSAKAMKDVGQAPAGEPKPSKYHNKRVERDGRKFASIREADYADELDALVKMKAVAWYCRQATHDLGGGVSYRSDFIVVFPGGEKFVHVVDAKGMKLPMYKAKKKLVKAKWGIEVQET